jgi:hypothetical protein
VSSHGIKGLAWQMGRDRGEPARPFIRIWTICRSAHELLLDKYRMPLISAIHVCDQSALSGRCTYCIKHVSYQYTARLGRRS